MKFHETSTTALRRSGSGRPPTTSSKQLSNKLKRLVLNKRRRSTRNVAPKMNVSRSAVLCNLKKLPNHTIQHWKLNPQLHLSKCRQDADKHGGYYGREKFSPGVILWGGISWNGLIPREAPVFIDEFLEGYQWPKCAKKTMNGTRYADLIRIIAYPAIMQQYRNQIPIFQDDAARIHRTQAVLQQIDALFNERIPVDVQSPKFDDQHWKLNPQLHLSKWQRLVNTDFSKSFRLTPQLNFKNDIIWCTSRQDADKHGGYYGRENFSPGVMLWGGISWNGLIPREAPVFIDEFLEGYQWPK
ncbi:unnamed protein product [Rotaria sordida]|uniref:Uncharacterized protein n=1 Tax=Rotaria sordida TaxID=392033 RepID=A0A815N7Z7_9BILA|nr:unnamed protein product [Rotaria sordida]